MGIILTLVNIVDTIMEEMRYSADITLGISLGPENATLTHEDLDSTNAKLEKKQNSPCIVSCLIFRTKLP